MDHNHNTAPNSNTPKAERLQHLHSNRETTEKAINTGYSSFIKKVQIALPILAILLVSALFLINNQGDKIVAVEQEDVQPQIRQQIGKNELINPKFESQDSKGQSFSITADKATQESTNPDGEMLLENPIGTLNLNSGDTVQLTSDSANYQQNEQYIDLKDNVKLSHSLGYEMQTEALNINLTKNKAWSDQTVRVTGKEGSIDATGLEASVNQENDKEVLIFKGPAIMQLDTNQNSNIFGDMLP